MRKAITLLVVSIGLSTQAQATGILPEPVVPQQLNGSTYAQDFNTLASTGGQVNRALPTGWQIYEMGTNTNANGDYYAGSTTGQASAVGAVSFGQNAADRALGGRVTAEVPYVSFGAIFQNNLGGSIDSLSLGYSGEQWVNGYTRATLKFKYSVDATALNNGTWTSVPGLSFLAPSSTAQGTGSTLDRIGTTSVNGNTAAFQQKLNGTIDGLSIFDGSNFGVRWSLSYLSDPFLIGDTVFNVTSNDGLGIDDFGLSASLSPVAAVPESATWAMMLVGFGGIGFCLRRRRNRATTNVSLA